MTFSETPVSQIYLDTFGEMTDLFNLLTVLLLIRGKYRWTDYRHLTSQSVKLINAAYMPWLFGEGGIEPYFNYLLHIHQRNEAGR